MAYVAPELVERGHEVVVVGGEPTRMHALLDSAGVHHHAAPRVSDVVRATLRGPRPDVVHVHMTAAELAAVVTRPKLRRPIVSTLHFAGPRGGGGLRSRVYNTLLQPHLAEEIAISHFVARSAGAPLVIWNGIPPATAGRGEEAPVVFMAQRLEEEKDTRTAVAAWAAAGLGSAGWELHIAGGGAKRHELQTMAREAGVDGSIRWLGRVDDVDARMRTAAIFLATAVAEPFGLSVVEAMRAALPVVAADGGAHGELLDRDGAQLFRPGDLQGCAGALRRLATAEPERRKLGERNRARFDDEFTIERHVSRLEAVYRDVVRRGS